MGMNPESIPYRLACLQRAVELTSQEQSVDKTLQAADRLYEWLLGPVPKPEKATVSHLRGVE